MALAYIGCGANLGERERQIKDALQRMSAFGIKVEKVSSFMESAPYGPVDQPDFINAVCLVSTDLSPGELLAALKRIERDMDRLPAARWGPRNIDLDILLYDKIILDNGDLTIPHKDLLNRPFALLPLIQLAGEGFVHPVSGLSLKEHLAALETREKYHSTP
ncbi:MAG: 2-amino-4-hydroxy-6-hydroxymethyldihydropteridine diphosphokinase [Acidaminococcales bacterium]|jgi:2-amino-4-hydroxy-6-hydroxymethyldihydropteridine diphosphokinase|nr:2-amino-4-hydroxy-6-hydroxymethyldihydropteridine diphosphokinase [Acidaminococcales bacterium]